MTTIASLRVALTADSTALQKGMAKARASVAKFGAAVTAVGAGLGALTVRGLNSADAIQKLSLRTGVGTEALSALKHAADQADVKISDLEDGFNDLNRNIDQAVMGTGAQADALKRLGLSVNQLQSMKPEDQFGLIADRLNALGTESARAKIGNDLLGGSYRRLLPLIKGGSEGMRQAGVEAQKLGLILSKDQADAAARANDAMTKLRNTFNGITQQIAVAFAPSIEGLLTKLGEELPAIIAGVRAGFVGVGTAIGGIAFAANKLFSGDALGAYRTISRLKSDVNAAIEGVLSESLPKAGANLNFGGAAGGGGKSFYSVGGDPELIAKTAEGNRYLAQMLDELQNLGVAQ